MIVFYHVFNHRAIMAHHGHDLPLFATSLWCNLVSSQGFPQNVAISGEHQPEGNR